MVVPYDATTERAEAKKRRLLATTKWPPLSNLMGVSYFTDSP